jgi:hypothetical protein
MGKFCPRPKICPKRGEAKKGFCLSSSCFAQKRGSRLGAQETEDSRRLAEVRAPRLRVGGEKIRLLCPIEVFVSLIKGRGGQDRAKNDSFLKICSAHH